jgi:hypothetical protein
MMMKMMMKNRGLWVGIGKSLEAKEVIGHAEWLFRQMVRLESQRST